MPDYPYSRPAITVDCVVFGLDDRNLLKILLIRRGEEPFKGEWAFPGGFVRVDTDDSLDASARRELQEETGVRDIFLEQLYVFSKKDRDPREWVISVAYYALINLTDHPIHAATDASEATWVSIEELPALAFDHQEIMDMAISRLRKKVRHEPIGFELLPKKFTLPQLQKLYEIILGRKLDRRNFVRKFLNMELLIDLNERQKGVAHRAAKFYQFDKAKYEQRKKEEDFNFEI